MTTSDLVQVAVGGATGVLALATFYMAKKTRDVAESTKEQGKQTRQIAESAKSEAEAVSEQATITRASLQASIQPWLTRVTPPLAEATVMSMQPIPFAYSINPGEEPHRVYVDVEDHDLRVTLWLRNVGSGVALIRAGDECVIEGLGLADEPVTRYGFPSAAALPPGEASRLSFRVEGVDVQHFLSRHRSWGEFWVRVLYTDVNTEQPVWANVNLTSADSEGREWLFHRIEYVRGKEEGPFASVRFDAAIESAPDAS